MRSTKFYVGIMLVAALILSSWYGASHYLQQLYPTNNNTSNSANNVSLSVLFNYGNDTSHWINSTRAYTGSTFYNTTISLTNGRLEATYYASFHAHLITSINGVKNSGSSYWEIWIYCAKDRAWMSSNWGADFLKPTNNGLSVENSLGNPILLSSNALAWSYQATSDPNPPVAGAAKVDLCS